MSEPRSLKETEVERLVHFLDRELRPGKGWSIQDEYPTTFTSNNSRNLFIIEEEDRVLSHAAVRYILLKTPQAVLKIAAIGSVVTSPEHRNQGLSHKILQICLENATKEGADIAILWSDLVEFYHKLGFEMAGSEVGILIDDYLPASEADLIYRQGSNIAPEVLLKLYAKHTVTSVRTLDDVRKYLKIPHSRVYTAWSKTGQLEAYAVEGKGADLKGYIHEWGGGVSKLIGLFNYIKKQTAEPLTVICPRHSEGLIRKFEELNVSLHWGNLGMIKILNAKPLIQKVMRHAKHLGHGNFVLAEDNGRFLVGVGDSLGELPTAQHLTKLLFGPIPDGFWSNFSPEKQKILKEILPLDLWVWGWDSV